MIRVLVSWKYMEPQVGRYEDEAEERLDRLVRSAAAHGMRVTVTFFAEDGISELNDASWRGKRDPRTDQYLIQREVQLVQHVANRLRGQEAVDTWELGDEAFCLGFRSADALERWTGTLREAIREVDADRDVVVPLDPETFQHAAGVDARRAIDVSDRAVAHVTEAYRTHVAQGPVTSGISTHLYSFLIRSADRHLPVVLDRVGPHGYEQSLADEAASVRTALYSALISGATGAVLGRYRDVETEHREPYFLDPYETLTGVADHEGTPKPTLAEVRSFAALVGRLGLAGLERPVERAAVVIPRDRFDRLPSLAGAFAPRACLQAFACAKEAHVPIDVIREEERFGAYLALVLPAVGALEDETVERLAGFVQAGGHLVLSYGGGDMGGRVLDLLGVEYMGDAGSSAELSCRVAQPGALGGLRDFEARMPVKHRARIGGTRATVVATDSEGAPLVTVHRFGQGRAVFLAAPLELGLAHSDPWARPEPVRHLLTGVYGSVIGAAGAGIPVTCDDPEVEVSLFTGREAGDVLVMLNHAPEKRRCSVGLERVVETVAEVRGGEPVAVGDRSFEVGLGPNGPAVLRLSYPGAGSS